MNNKFAENLKKIRKDNNLSQEQLAEELNVSRQAISKWESAVAYPEMDKIIAIGERFNLNIDDLLHKDIREIKGEEESKKNLSKYVDSFLNFITNTINMFSNMTFKSKIKCLLEQIIIAIILFTTFMILGEVIKDLFLSILINLLPDNIYYFVISILRAIYCLFSISVSIMIMLHIYKTRYLDYFEDIKIESNKEIEKDNNEGKQKVNLEEQTEDNIDTKNKFLFKRNEKKVIIRDPKHSEYKFITGISIIIVAMIKFFVLCFSVSFFVLLATLAFTLVLSFLTIKTGVFFLGMVILIISLIIITIDIILLALNFVFNRKNNKKILIWSFIISLIFVGIGGGITSLGILNFEYVENPKNIYETKSVELDMTDDLFFETYYDHGIIEYVPSNNSNIRVEYSINKYCEIETDRYNHDGLIWFGINCSDPIKIINYTVKELNNKKVVSFTNEFESIKIYTTKENIKKIKNNKIAYDKKQINECE